MTRTKKQSTEAAVREIRRKTRRKFAPEEKVRIVLEGLRGEQSISELCRREGIASNLYYRWSKDFLCLSTSLRLVTGCDIARSHAGVPRRTTECDSRVRS